MTAGVTRPSAALASLSRNPTRAEVSLDGKWLAVTDLWNDVHLYNMKTLRYHLSLPRLGRPVTALAFRASGQGASLVIVAADNSVRELVVDAGTFSDWSLRYGAKLPAPFLKKATTDPVRQVTVNPTTSQVILGGHSYMCLVDMDKPVTGCAAPPAPTPPVDDKSKGRRRKRRPSVPVPSADNFRLINRYGPTVHTQFIGANELLVVEVPWVRAVRHLPAALYRKQYGT